MHPVLFILILAVVLSGIAAFLGKPNAYPWFRASLAAAQIIPSLVLVALVIFNARFAHGFSHLDEREFAFYRQAVIFWSIPGICGVLAAIGPKRALVRMTGRLLIHVLLPGAFIWEVIMGGAPLNHKMSLWIGIYLVLSCLCWETLITASRRHAGGKPPFPP